MKKSIVIISVLSVLSLTMINTQAIAQTNDKDRGTISVSTSADADISPDVADISFSVVTSDNKSMQKAVLINKDISEKVYNILKEQINTSNGDYIKTSNYNAAPVYIYKDRKQILDKYEVSNKVTVHTKSLDKLGSMIDKSIEAGATNVGSLNFSISNFESQCNSLIESATKKANSRASIAAKSSGTTLDGIMSMNVSCSENKNYNAPRVMMSKSMALGASNDAMDEAKPTTTISAGVIKVYSNVNATFFVK